MKTRKKSTIKLNRQEIVVIIKTSEEANYNWIEEFYKKEEFLVVILSNTRKFDSDSNVIEVEEQNQFVQTIFEALENEKIVIAYNTLKTEIFPETETIMKFQFIYAISDQEIVNVNFRLAESRETL